jgi:hypothetical protein
MNNILRNLIRQLAHCMVFLGKKWSFMQYTESERELLDKICDFPDERIIDFIRPELLDQ